MLTNLRTWFCRSVMTLLLMLPVTLGWADGYIHYGIAGDGSSWSDAKLNYNDDSSVGTVDIQLVDGQNYEFLLKVTGTGNPEGSWYKFSGTPQEVTVGTSYALSISNGGNGRISNAKGGTYTFTVKWEEGKPSISITYSTSVPANLPSSLTFRSDYTGWDNTDRSMTMEANGKKWSYTIDFTSGSIPNAVWFRLIDTKDANHSIISKSDGDEVPVDGDAIEGEMKGSDNRHNFKFIPSGYSKYTITAEYIESKWMVSVKSVGGSEIPEPTVDTYYLIIPNANVGNTRRAVPASEGIAPAGHTAFKFTQTRMRESITLMKDLTTINLKIDGDKGQQLRYDSNGEISFYIKAGATAYRPTSGDDELAFNTNTSTNGVDAYVSRTDFASDNNYYYKIKRSTVGEKTKSVTFMFSKNNANNGNSIGGSNGNANSRPYVSGNLIVGFMQTRGYGSAYYDNHINKEGSGVYLVGKMGVSYSSNKDYPMTKIVYPADATDESADSIVYVCEVKKNNNKWDNFFLSFSTGDIVGQKSGEQGIYWNLLLRPNVQNQMDGQALEGGVFFFANDQTIDNQQQALNPLLSAEQKNRYVSYKVYFNATYSTYRIEFYDNFYIAGPAVHGKNDNEVNIVDYFKPDKRLAMRTEEVHGVKHYVYTGKFIKGSTFAFFVTPDAYACNYSEDDNSQYVSNNKDGMWDTQAPEGGGDYPFHNHVRWNENGDNDTGSLGPNNHGIKWTLETGTYTLRFYYHNDKSGKKPLYTIDKVVTLKNATSEFVEKNGASVKHNYGGWRTFSDDCALWLPNGIKAYYASEITAEGKVKLTEVENGMIPAHTGVLIYDGNLLDGSEDIHLYPVPTDYTTQLGSGTTNLFVDCYDKDYIISYQEDDKYNYFFTCFYKKRGDFSKSNVPMNFWKTRDQNALAKKNYTYLQVSKDINPRAFNSETKNYEPEPDATNVANNARDYCFLFSLDDLDDPLITGITAPAVENSMETKAEGWYTMQGVKIQKPVKAGMYILNGRKVIVR